MELCYEGGLVLPSSYAMMDEEEMTYVEGGSASAAVLAKNLKGLYNSCVDASRALKMGGITLGYIARIASMTYSYVAGSIAASLGVTLGTINVCLGIIAAAGAVGVTYYLATNRVYY